MVIILKKHYYYQYH